jgi:hypothetical protein
MVDVLRWGEPKRYDRVRRPNVKMLIPPRAENPVRHLFIILSSVHIPINFHGCIASTIATPTVLTQFSTTTTTTTMTGF